MILHKEGWTFTAQKENFTAGRAVDLCPTCLNVVVTLAKRFYGAGQRGALVCFPVYKSSVVSHVSLHTLTCPGRYQFPVANAQRATSRAAEENEF